MLTGLGPALTWHSMRPLDDAMWQHAQQAQQFGLAVNSHDSLRLGP